MGNKFESLWDLMCISIVLSHHSIISLNTLTQATPSAVKHPWTESCPVIRWFLRRKLVSGYTRPGTLAVVRALHVAPSPGRISRHVQQEPRTEEEPERANRSRLLWWPLCCWGREDHGHQERLLHVMPKSFTRAWNSTWNEPPEPRSQGLENVSLSKCELLSHPAHVRQTVLSSQRAPLNHCYHQITDVALQESLSCRLL